MSTKVRNILFLDIDGVLNSLSSNAELSEDLLKNLKVIVDHFKCEIVISSSWRCYEDSLKTLTYAFEEHNIPRWKSITPDLCGERWTEIKGWIDENVNELCNVIVLDDDIDADLKDNTPDHVNYYFFQTDVANGLDNDATKIVLEKIFSLAEANF
jgi:hypothetical protein